MLRKALGVAAIEDAPLRYVGTYREGSVTVVCGCHFRPLMNPYFYNPHDFAKTVPALTLQIGHFWCVENWRHRQPRRITVRFGGVRCGVCGVIHWACHPWEKHYFADWEITMHKWQIEENERMRVKSLFQTRRGNRR